MISAVNNNNHITKFGSFYDPVLMNSAFTDLNEFFLKKTVFKNADKTPKESMGQPEVLEISQIIAALVLGAKCVSQALSKTCSFTLKSDENKEPTDAVSLANHHFVKSLVDRNCVAGIASNESEEFFDCRNDKNFVILINPLDGHQQIDLNVSVGTIFSIYKRKSKFLDRYDFLQAGDQQVCSGYFIYGTSTMFVYTTGDGVYGFTLDPITGNFFISHRHINIPQNGSIYSVNGGKYSRFSQPIRNYLDDCQNRQLSCRYIGSLVADFHRNMLKGGIFIYPPTYIDPKPSVSLVFQCLPLAFVIEQANGKASDGFTHSMNITPKTFCERTTFFCGSSKMVENIEQFMREINDKECV